MNATSGSTSGSISGAASATWRAAVVRRSLVRILLYILLTIIVALIAIPFIWMISSAFKDQTSIYASPPLWVPHPLVTDNFVSAWSQVPFGQFFLNSLKVAGLNTIGQLVTCTLAAYAFARLRFPGRDIIFGIYLVSLMAPSQVTIIPLYILMKDFGYLIKNLGAGYTEATE